VSRRRLIALAAAVAAFAAGVAAVALRRDGEAGPLSASIAARPDSLVLLDVGDGRPLADVPLGAEPTRLAYGEGAFWAAAPEDGLVIRVDERERTASRFAVGEEPYDVAVGGGAVWVPDHDAHRLFRLDPDSGDVRGSDDLGQPAISVGFGFGSVWLVVASGDLLRIDPQTLEVTSREPRAVATAENAEPKLVFRDDTLWISSPASSSLVRIASDGRIVTDEAIGITSVAVLPEGRAWFAQDAGFLQRVEGAERVEVGTRPLDLASTEDELWVAAYDDRAAKRVDPGESRVTGQVGLGASPVAVAVGEELIAFAVQSG
jgi:streptogramin lyase